MTKLITTIDQLPPALRDSVSPAERAFVEGLEAAGGRAEAAGRLPFAVTPHFASLAGPEADDPIRRQFFPDPRESEDGPFALQDPLGEARYRVTPRLVHQYPDRALLLAGGACAGYCRHCFRRVRMSGVPAFIGDDELAPALAYLKAHPEIREVLVSGGDPLMAPDNALEALFSKLRRANPALSLRICTRAPVTAPERITPELVKLCRSFLRQPPSAPGPLEPLRFAVHINHPRELSPLARQALDSLVSAGITVLVQTVLLKGINDSVDTLAALFTQCHALGLSPYYLFQLDLAPGTAHFRVPLKQGLVLYRGAARAAGITPSSPARPQKGAWHLVTSSHLVTGSHLVTSSHLGDGGRCGGLPPAEGEAEWTARTMERGGDFPPLPVYAVDLPGGGGKIWLDEDSIAGEEQRPEGRVYLLKGPDGTRWPYPAD
jgi:lysine 2,3-aminomutase